MIKKKLTENAKKIDKFLIRYLKNQKRLTYETVTLPCYHTRDIDEPIDELYFSQKNFRVKMKSYQQF